ncbi:VOC family protein [Bosea sp. (in: a-proteobacteria)]|uniref:VOC family protein n=1 Tax=Bosea sp. (in: a-proteobacteria) TaxID=1871050 RepID=UPI003F6EFBBD
MYKPEGHNAVSPYLIVPDAEKALAFAKAAFGVEPIFVARRDDGRITHCEIRIDDSVVMIGEMEGGPESHVHVYVADPDAVFARARAAGATVVQELMAKGDGDRRGGLKDPTGTTWWLAQCVDSAARERTNRP